jgi:hypothetical protein
MRASTGFPRARSKHCPAGGAAHTGGRQRPDGASTAGSFGETHRSPDRPIAIQIETAPGPEDCPRAAVITDEWRAAVDDYRKQNAATKFIRPGFDLGRTYSLVAWADVRQMLKDGGYLSPNAPVTNHFGSSVLSRFPGGRLIVLSALGFNPERTRAMVSVQSDCLWKDGVVGCHEIHTVGLRKTGGRWDPSGIGCHGIA